MQTSELYPWSWFRVYITITQPSQWLSLAPEPAKLGSVDKLIPNLNNKTYYVVHYENLKLYESLGLKIAKIHRGIQFE